MASGARIVLGLVLAFGAAEGRARPKADASGRLAAIEALYSAGDYDAASRQLTDLLVHDGTAAPAVRAQLFLMKARIELAFGRPDEIPLWLAKAFDANPALALDPLRDPPTLIAAWKDVQKPRPAPSPAPPSAGTFALGLLPLGLGHFDAGRPRDGALFLATESLFLLAAATLPGDDPGVSVRRRARLLGGATLLGAYGFELVDMLPDLARRDAEAADKVRGSLALFPFGVGQAANGEPLKAALLAAVDATLLTAATLAAAPPQRSAALAGFAVAWGYGILDGVLHRGGAVPDPADGNAGVSLLPVRGERGWGMAATLVWKTWSPTDRQRL